MRGSDATIALEDMLIDLVQVAEAPLYSTYRWLGREIGRETSLEEFLNLIERMLQRRLLRLWSVEYVSGVATELFRVPHDLAEQYRTVELADYYDPFGLSLTLGAAADPAARPAWEADFDFDEGTFELRAPDGQEETVIAQMQRLVPGTRLIEKRKYGVGGEVHVAGDIELQR